MLYHTNQITDIQVKSTEYHGNRVVFHSNYTPKKLLCPCCGHHEHHFKGNKVRMLRIAPIGLFAAFLRLKINRLKCNNCGKVWWPSPSFVNGKRRVTQSFERYVISMMNFSTIEHTSKFLGVSWHLVKQIHKDYLKKEYVEPDLSVIRYIGVDEFSIRKGHDYMTIFINLETNEIIYAVEGRSVENVKSFFIKLNKEAFNLEAIAMDMNASYALAVKTYLADVDIIYDRFHISGLLSRSIDEIRREQQTKCNEIGLKVLKGSRFLLLKNYERLDPTKRDSLNELLKANMPLSVAHQMKEQLRLFWDRQSRIEGTKFLCCWIMDAVESGVKELEKTGRTILRHAQDILNYFKHRITNGKTEGVNNKIKTMKRQAYGFRDVKYFKLRLYNLHKTRYSFAR